jgi:hypothetical protein
MASPQGTVPGAFHAPEGGRSVCVWGLSRASVNRKASELAAQLDADFVWFDVRIPWGPPGGPPVEVNDSPLRHQVFLDPPRGPESRRRLEKFGHSDAATASRTRAQDPSLRFRVPKSDGPDGPRLLVVANLDHLDLLPATKESTTRHWMNQLRTDGIELMVTYRGIPPPGRFGVRYSIQVGLPLSDPLGELEGAICETDRCAGCELRSMLRPFSVICRSSLAESPPLGSGNLVPAIHETPRFVESFRGRNPG